jgi:YesN/AraC family two-component response regulator
MGFTPIAAENGRKGIEMAVMEQPDLILIDI